MIQIKRVCNMVDSTDAGLLTSHELDDALRLCELAADVLLNIRGGKNIHHLPMGSRGGGSAQQHFGSGGFGNIKGQEMASDPVETKRELRLQINSGCIDGRILVAP